MKVEIQNIDSSNCKGYHVYADSKMLSTPKVSMNTREWDDNEIEHLIGQNNYLQFEQGKYTFNLPTWKIRLIEGKQTAKTREQLLFISKFF